jgi:hypothetical protein
MAVLGAVALSLGSSSGCYHYAFDLAVPVKEEATVTYVDHPPTFLNGFIGKGRVDAQRYCDHPIRTELKVGATDVLVSVATLLVYTPHTLEVTCPLASSTPLQSRASAPASRFR